MASNHKGSDNFSQELDSWLRSSGPKTFGELERVFSEKSFAVAFLVLMAPAALPLPTGGITHLFELINMLLSLELIAGKTKIWTPMFWQRRNLGANLQKKALPKLAKFIAWFEKRSHKRFNAILNNRLALRVVGVLVFGFTLLAAIAPPFTGLDTLPALAVVLISLALILEDATIIIYAVLAGLAGALLEFTLGSVAWHFLRF